MTATQVKVLRNLKQQLAECGATLHDLTLDEAIEGYAECEMLVDDNVDPSQDVTLKVAGMEMDFTMEQLEAVLVDRGYMRKIAGVIHTRRVWQ